MDLYWDKTYIEQQKLAFIEQCQAKERNLPLSSMFATLGRTFETMDKVNDDELCGVFHCFKEAKKKLKHWNKTVRIGGVCTYKNGGLDEVFRSWFRKFGA